MANINHANSLPSFKKDAVENSTAITWASGNTKTVTNAHVKSTSRIVVIPTSLPAGRWYVSAVSNGSFTITSSDAESNATFKYIIL